jgi:DNA-binding NarL/FixJ family response regulator
MSYAGYARDVVSVRSKVGRFQVALWRTHDLRVVNVSDVQPTLSVLLADEQALFRDALGVALERENDIEVVAAVSDGIRAVSEVKRLLPDVVLLSAALPGCDGLTATRLISEHVPGCKVLVLTAVEDDRVLVDALEAGARGYLSKQSTLVDLVGAVHSVHRSETLVPPKMLSAAFARLIDHRREQDSALRLLDRLTARQREVLRLLADGAGNDAIAAELSISPDTARTHIQMIIRKLEVHSRLEAAVFVTRNRLLDELSEPVPSWRGPALPRAAR